MSDQIVWYCSAPCGSGKTHQITNRVFNSIKGDTRVFIAQPTKQLIDKTVAESLTSRLWHPDYKIFHGDRVGARKSVAGELVDYLKVDPAPVLFVTHSLIPIVPYWHRKSEYDLIIDEELQVIKRFSFTVPETHWLVTALLQIEPLGPIYGRVLVQDESLFRQRKKNERGDELIATFGELFQVLDNSHYHTYVNMEQYERVCTGSSVTLTFQSILQPSAVEGFRSVFMAAAKL
jgi:hypothetical protein